MANTVEEVKAEGPGDAHLGAEEDGGPHLQVLKNETKNVKNLNISKEQRVQLMFNRT